MKYTTDRLFGYPVLLGDSSNDADYPDKKFEPSIKLQLCKSDFTKYTVAYDFHLDSVVLNNLLDEAKAKFVIRIACNKSLFSFSKVCDRKGSLEIDANKLRDQVEISAFLVANESLTLKSKLGEFHADFGGNEFLIAPGNVLAYPAPKTYYIAKDNFKTITSIFEWKALVNHEKDAFSVDLNVNDDKVVIVALASQIALFKDWIQGTGSKDIATNVIFVPALTQAVERLKVARADYQDHRWANIILTKCQNLGIDIDSDRWTALKIAQRLLGHPIKLLNSQLSDAGD